MHLHIDIIHYLIGIFHSHFEDVQVLFPFVSRMGQYHCILFPLLRSILIFSNLFSSFPTPSKCGSVCSLLTTSWTCMGTSSNGSTKWHYRRYIVNVTSVDGGEELITFSQTTIALVQNLDPFTTYVCTVSAETVAPGPFSPPIVFQTAEDGEVLHHSDYVDSVSSSCQVLWITTTCICLCLLFTLIIRTEWLTSGCQTYCSYFYLCEPLLVSSINWTPQRCHQKLHC